MATEKTEKTTDDLGNRAMQALAASYRRQIATANVKAYKRAVKAFARDGECSEDQAKAYLSSIGVSEPPAPNGK